MYDTPLISILHILMPNLNPTFVPHNSPNKAGDWYKPINPQSTGVEPRLSFIGPAMVCILLNVKEGL